MSRRLTRRIADAARRSSSRSSYETTVDVMPETFAVDETKNEQDRGGDQAAVQKSLAELTSGQREATLQRDENLTIQPEELVKILAADAKPVRRLSPPMVCLLIWLGISVTYCA